MFISRCSTCAGDYPLAKDHGLSPRTGGQTMALLLHVKFDEHNPKKVTGYLVSM